MPRSTMRFPFEAHVFAWASDFSRRLAGDASFAFLLVLDVAGVTRRVHVGPRPMEFDPGLVDSLTEGEAAHLFYDPFDFPEYGSVAWKGIPRPVMERLLGRAFVEADFRPLHGNPAGPVEYPATWNVMY